MKWILTFIVTLCLVYQVRSQQVSDPVIKVIVQPRKDSIILRWAPTTPSAWQLLNKFGYRIERYTIMRDSTVLDTKPIVTIQPVPIKPHTQADWQREIERDDFVAIAAQAIFGETFKIDIKSTDIMQVATKAKEMESRFAYALFAADISARAAFLSGLRYVDKDIKVNETYLYRVYSLVPDEKLKITMGFVYTAPVEERPLPVIQDISVNPGDRNVMLSWNLKDLVGSYSGYYVERSDDGKNYHRLNKLPYVPVDNNTGSPIQYATFLDSLQSNDQMVSYRVIGITPFAEWSAPSHEITCKGVDKNDARVDKLEGSVNLSGKATLRWVFAAKKEPLINGFEVERSNQADKGFKTISKVLSPSVRDYEDVAPLSTNYYRISSIDKSGKRKNSFPILLQKEDSIPPAPPRNVTAVVDTAGFVHISWAKNDEMDMVGYRVYRSRFKNSEYAQVTVSPVKETAFTDTLNIRTLSRNCYYKLTAVDTRFNASVFSTIIEVILSDIIPPVRVVFTSAKATPDGISLAWTKCSSEDAVSYRVYRRSPYSKEADLLATLPADSTHILDIPPLEINYTYWINVIDKSGLISQPSQPITIAPLAKPISAIFKNLEGVAVRDKMQIRITWKYEELSQLRSIQVYRFETTAGILSLYKTISTGESFVDDNVKMNTLYGYRLKAIYRNGKESMFSDEIRINF